MLKSTKKQFFFNYPLKKIIIVALFFLMNEYAIFAI